MRTIVVDEVEYKWKVGKRYVEIRAPGIKYTPTLVEASNGQYADRDFEKKNASITPSMIAEYIRKQA